MHLLGRPWGGTAPKQCSASPLPYRHGFAATPSSPSSTGKARGLLRRRVIHDSAGHRFCVKRKGYEACLMYRVSGTEIDLYHTYVPEVFRGKGMAEQLCKAAFEHAKAHHLTAIPSCSYISDAYLRRRPEYGAPRASPGHPVARPRSSSFGEASASPSGGDISPTQDCGIPPWPRPWSPAEADEHDGRPTCESSAARP